ncbi:vomeronasal type-2 receptor 26-like [Spea bombifrons]|uniref:vomeronasal type-2 receptor 26-like n=1 Tax=Spea bombifrons TaxID=233779 RepID=UPI00234C02A0|nr:vomeronasal type-2 receptor 26-like [Spea bombifrons]
MNKRTPLWMEIGEEKEGIREKDMVREKEEGKISYGATHSVLSDRRVYPTFFRTVQNDHVSYYILSKLLKHFGWNWVGILTTDDESGDNESQSFSDVFNGTLTLKPYYSDHVPKLSFFLEKFHPKNYPDDKLLEDLWITAFECLSPDPYKNQYYEIHFGMSLRNCTGRERLEDIVNVISNGDASRVNNAVLVMAKALHNMNIFQEKKVYGNEIKITNYKHRLHHYIRNLKAEDQSSHLYFDENGEYVTLHIIRNWIGNKEEVKSFKVVGVFDPWAPADQQLNINPGLITWKNEANQVMYGVTGLGKVAPNWGAKVFFIMMVDGVSVQIHPFIPSLAGLTDHWLQILDDFLDFCNASTSISEIRSPAPACHLQVIEPFEDYEYFKDGDLIIGGVLTVNSHMRNFSFSGQDHFSPQIVCVILMDYINLLVFLFAIETLNNDPNVLPNITLGYHIYDSCLDKRKAVKSILQILSGRGMTVPNYSCANSNNVAGFIGDHHSTTTIPIAQLLGVYGYAQISYGATDYALSDRRVYPHFFRSVQNYLVYNKIILKILKHFGWTWVGILTVDDDTGETESQALRAYLTSYGIYGQQLIIDSHLAIWRNKDNQIPRSQCSENCLPGYRKVLKPGTQICCYDCVRCSEGEISNRSDSENCIVCPRDKWSNEKRDRCIPKSVEFLSYLDAVAAVLSFASILFCLVTVVILLIFIDFRDTPIVKANNKNLSFLLLVSIMLSLLCVFLFLGRPEDVTCMLRQTAFGVLFSLAVSCILSKTIMIYIVFRAVKPGSSWANWVSVKVSNSIVLLCSSIQVIINISWLAISPPFQELDMRSYQGKIIVQCNEGSVIAFYCVLGYMGLLAAVSFIIAFLARTLPDSFNEAKYITFSMLVFCSVWIAMIPAYLSTKGKNMVAVEIFAILASCAGLVGCIFIPKCYVILFRQELNTKTYLLGSRIKGLTK